jgi:hypothetical protein
VPASVVRVRRTRIRANGSGTRPRRYSFGSMAGSTRYNAGIVACYILLSMFDDVHLEGSTNDYVADDERDSMSCEDDMKTPVDEDRLKELLKAAIIEVLEERRELLRSLIEEALEDVAFARAIEEGETTELINRSEVLEILEGKE